MSSVTVQDMEPLCDDDGAAAFEVGVTDRPWTPVGSSGLRAPGRYSTTVRTAAKSRLIRWRTAELWRLLYSNPGRAAQLIEFITERGRAVLDAARGEMRAFPGTESAVPEAAAWAAATVTPFPADAAAAGFAFEGKPADSAALLTAAPFFREFSDDERSFFTDISRFVLLHRGDCVLREGTDAALYTDDMLHMNAAGYARWIGVLRTIIISLARQRAQAAAAPMTVPAA